MTQQHTLVCRREEKYILTLAQAAACQARLQAVLQRDAHAGGWGYRVESLYFDTPTEQDFFAQQNGEYARQKLRLRSYGGDVYKLECKQKWGELQRKLSLPLTPAQAQALCAGGWPVPDGAGDAETAAFFRSFFLRGYRPRILIGYDRQAFCLPGTDIRVTLDSGVVSCETELSLFAPGRAWLPVTAPGEVVLEVKYSGTLPPGVRRTLSPWAAQRNTCSKYGRGHRLFWIGDL